MSALNVSTDVVDEPFERNGGTTLIAKTAAAPITSRRPAGRAARSGMSKRGRDGGAEQRRSAAAVTAG